VTRIVAGVARGRRLAVPPRGTRPTSDRAREGLFSSLTSELGTLVGTSFLDLYAGSGAVGLEAASRGATRVVLVEADRGAARVLAANVDVVDVPGVEVVVADVPHWCAGPARGSFDVAFADPPYDVGAAVVAGVLIELVTGGWLTESSLVVVERRSRDGSFDWPAGLQADRSRRYGEATLWYGRRAAAVG
jgi:16S rRNA (guanine966-N2)-methyltransferase